MNYSLQMNRKRLYIIAALIWGIPGAILTVKGIRAYCIVPTSKLWWLLLITLSVLGGFFFMFSKIVVRYSGMIAELPERTSIWHTFPLRGWVLIVFMMCLGMGLKMIPALPIEFIASFYCGIGPMLILSAWNFIKYGYIT